jgi:hypothetical protein
MLALAPDDGAASGRKPSETYHRGLPNEIENAIDDWSGHQIEYT